MQNVPLPVFTRVPISDMSFYVNLKYNTLDFCCGVHGIGRLLGLAEPAHAAVRTVPQRKKSTERINKARIKNRTYWKKNTEIMNIEN